MEKTADAPEQRQLILKSARQSVGLLKNDAAVFPVRSTAKKIGVTGPNEDKLSNCGYSSKVVTGDIPLAARKRSGATRWQSVMGAAAIWLIATHKVSRKR